MHRYLQAGKTSFRYALGDGGWSPPKIEIEWGEGPRDKAQHLTEELMHWPGRAPQGEGSREVADSAEEAQTDSREMQEHQDLVTSGPVPGVQQVGGQRRCIQEMGAAQGRGSCGGLGVWQWTPGDQGGTLIAV